MLRRSRQGQPIVDAVQLSTVRKIIASAESGRENRYFIKEWNWQPEIAEPVSRLLQRRGLCGEITYQPENDKHYTIWFHPLEVCKGEPEHHDAPFLQQPPEFTPPPTSPRPNLTIVRGLTD